MSRSLQVFATRSDWSPAMEEFELRYEPQFVKVGPWDSPAIVPIGSLSHWDKLGIAAFGDQARETTYLIIPKDEPIVPRAVAERSGRVRYVVDQGENPVSVAFRPGGLYKSSCLIAGYIGTVSPDRSAARFYSEIIELLLSGFTKVKSYHLGPDAMRLLNDGFRLTYHHQAPVDYDLRL